MILKTRLFKVFEFSIILIFIGVFLSKLYWHLSGVVPLKPDALDIWHMCSIHEYQITRILGLNPGGIWDGNTFYPFNATSILFDEPFWGISLLITPLWVLTKSIFGIFRLGGIVALFLSCILTYYFVKKLGGTRIWSFFAGGSFCLSGISLILITCESCFWLFFFIPLLGIITLKIFSTSRLSWGLLWGILFGYLAWSSAHLFVMGGVFLCLFVLWNLIFNNHTKKTLLVLLVAFILSGMIAAAVLGPMYVIQEKFQFYRGYYEPWQFASNWVNLIYRRWPDMPFNPATKMPFWEYFKANAKGDTNIGMSFLLLFIAMIIFIIRLKNSIPSNVVNKYLKYILPGSITFSILLAFLNMHSLTARCMQLKLPLPNLAVGLTYLYYVITGIIIYLIRKRIIAAIKHLDFFLLLSAIFFGFLAFGPYYLTKNNQVVASPVAFLQYYVPGFSGIRGTARWGLIFSFTLSVAVAIFLSNAKSRRSKIGAVIFVFISFLELTPGFKMPEFRILTPYKWTPRQTDIFLKSLPDNGAVLELASYPIVLGREQYSSSDNSLGYSLFSRLYHKKPLVLGYSSHLPDVTEKYLYSPENNKLTFEKINILRKFGAKYWVFHIEGWSKPELQLLNDLLGELKKIATLDDGKTLIYEDPNPKASVGYYDVI